MSARPVPDVFHFATTPAPLGNVGVGMTRAGKVALILWGDTPDTVHEKARHYFSDAVLSDEPDKVKTALEAVCAYLEAPRADFAFPLPLVLRGTDFQRQVWQALTTIPFGKTISYSALAAQIDAPKAVRAVAQACGQNPCGIVVPCHRVIGKNGTLTGYGYGLSRKKYLLEREGALFPR